MSEAESPGDRRGGVSRNVLLLGIVSFFADASSEMVYPIIPLFLVGTLGAPAIAVGVIEGIAESTASFAKFFSGWLSDRVRRRLPFVFGGYGIAALAKPALAAAYAWPVVLLVRFADRTGKGIRGAPRDAIIAASADGGSLGRAFGMHRALDTLGAIIGPLVLLLLLAVLGDERFRPIFLIAFVPGAISALLVLVVREPRSARRRRDAAPGPALLSLEGYDPRFLWFLGVTAIFAAGNSSDAFLILRARDLGLGAAAAVGAYIVYNTVYAALSLPAGIRSDASGRERVLITGFAVFALVYAGFAFAGDRWAVWPLFAVYGAYMAFTDGVGKAYVADLVPEERRGAALGLYHGLLGAMLLIASVAGGALWDLIGPEATFALGASTAALAALALAVRPRPRPSGP